MNVLSLFDGMSCGQIALERAGVQVDNYYASELDKYAIKVTQANYPNTIQLGDVTQWREWSIDWSSIGLLIGGSPCQGFSFAGKQLAFDDPRSKLFFVYVDILNHIRAHNPGVKFLLENVRMKQESLDIVSHVLKTDAVFINSSLVSAQDRRRFYWASWDFNIPEDIGASLYSILDEKPPCCVKVREKSKCLRVGGRGSVDRHEWDSISNCHYRKLTPIECERLQTVSDNYTAHVSNTQRYKMLGNGWTVDVIAHIFRSMPR